MLSKTVGSVVSAPSASSWTAAPPILDVGNQAALADLRLTLDGFGDLPATMRSPMVIVENVTAIELNASHSNTVGTRVMNLSGHALR